MVAMWPELAMIMVCSRRPHRTPPLKPHHPHRPHRVAGRSRWVWHRTEKSHLE